jgi:hypothetical protein
MASEIHLVDWGEDFDARWAFLAGMQEDSVGEVELSRDPLLLIMA